MLLELLLSIAMVLLLYQRWSKRDVYKLGKQLNSGIWTIPFLGHSYLCIGNGHTLMKAIQIFGRDAIRHENGLTSAWHGNYLYTIIADPGTAEVVLKTCLNKDDVMQLLQFFIGNASLIAPGSQRKDRHFQDWNHPHQVLSSKSCQDLDMPVAPSEVRNIGGAIDYEAQPSSSSLFTGICDGKYREDFNKVPIWRKRRKFLAPIFSMRNLKYFMTIFERESAILVQNMGKMAGSGVLSAFKYYTAYTMDAIAESTMGYKMGAQKNTKHPLLEAFGVVLRSASERLFKPWLHSDLVYHNLPFYSNLDKLNKYIADFMTEFIENKRKEMKENNITQEQYGNSSDDSSKPLLESLIRLSEQDKGFKNDEIREELFVIMVAGIDTSAVATSFTSLMLARHPEVQEKIYKELQEVFAESDRPPTFDDMPRLKYLDAVIRESMRLYPPVPVVIRKVEKEVLLPCGLKLVPGTGVMVNIWALHRNPRYWGDDAELFRPERFIDTPLTHPAAFMPFSYGPRNCVGYQYAMLSMKTVLSSVLRRYRILPATAPNNNSEYPPICLKYDIFMKEEEDFPIRLEPRC